MKYFDLSLFFFFFLSHLAEQQSKGRWKGNAFLNKNAPFPGEFEPLGSKGKASQVVPADEAIFKAAAI